MCSDEITLAVAPSVCVLRHCVSLPGEGLHGRVVSLNEISSVLAVGTFLSSAKKETNKLTSVHCSMNDGLMIPSKMSVTVQ